MERTWFGFGKEALFYPNLFQYSEYLYQALYRCMGIIPAMSPHHLKEWFILSTKLTLSMAWGQHIYPLGMRRYGHHTIRYVSIQRETIWLFSIRYDTDNNWKIQTFTILICFYLWTQQRNASSLVSFTNIVTRFTTELDKTNLFVKLKKHNAQLKFWIRMWRKWLLSLRTHSIYKKILYLHVWYM